MHLHSVIHGFFILFFAGLLLHALIYSKSTVVEGLDPAATATAAPANAAPANAAPATAAPANAAPDATKVPSQVQVDENTAEIAILKGQIATLMQTAQTLKTQMLQNEVGIQNNTNSIQKVVQSQTDMQTKLANAKSRQ
jgi:uncharacterized protein (DUF2252 family)